MWRPARISRGRSSRSWIQLVSGPVPQSRISSAPPSRSSIACASVSCVAHAAVVVEPDVAVRVDESRHDPALAAVSAPACGSRVMRAVHDVEVARLPVGQDRAAEEHRRHGMPTVRGPANPEARRCPLTGHDSRLVPDQSHGSPGSTSLGGCCEARADVPHRPELDASDPAAAARPWSWPAWPRWHHDCAGRRRRPATRPWSARWRARTPSPAPPRASGASPAPAIANIQGFATDISVDQGGTVGFKVDTNASSYRLDIYRMGYYNGDGARKVATVLPTVLNSQPNCITAPRPGWSTAATGPRTRRGRCRPTPCRGSTSPAVRTDGTAGESHIVFVVRDDDGGSDLLFQTSDTTWQAYNTYGGNSLYTGVAGRARLQGELQPAVHHARQRARGLGLQRRVPDGPVPRVQRLRRQLHAPAWTPTAVAPSSLEHKTFLSVGPRRVLVGHPARQRRGRARRRREPGVLQRQRGVLEDPVGEQHRRLRHAAPHAGVLQGDPRQRQDRSRWSHRPGPARGATRGSARPATAVAPRTP